MGSDLSRDQLAILRDPSAIGPGYDDLTQVEVLINDGYLTKSSIDDSYQRTDKGNQAIKNAG